MTGFQIGEGGLLPAGTLQTEYVVVVKGSDGKVANVNRAETMAEAQALRASL